MPIFNHNITIIYHIIILYAVYWNSIFLLCILTTFAYFILFYNNIYIKIYYKFIPFYFVLYNKCSISLQIWAENISMNIFSGKDL